MAAFAAMTMGLAPWQASLSMPASLTGEPNDVFPETAAAGEQYDPDRKKCYR